MLLLSLKRRSPAFEVGVVRGQMPSLMALWGLSAYDGVGVAYVAYVACTDISSLLFSGLLWYAWFIRQPPCCISIRRGSLIDGLSSTSMANLFLHPMIGFHILVCLASVLGRNGRDGLLRVRTCLLACLVVSIDSLDALLMQC